MSGQTRFCLCQGSGEHSFFFYITNSISTKTNICSRDDFRVQISSLFYPESWDFIIKARDSLGIFQREEIRPALTVF